jgi:hypothetical protein
MRFCLDFCGLLVGLCSSLNLLCSFVELQGFRMESWMREA